MLNVNLDGEHFTTTKSPDTLDQIAGLAGVDVLRLSVPANELEGYQADQARQKVRREIEPVAGDTQSIQGVIADNVGLLLLEVGRFMAAARTSSDPVIANAAQPLSDALSPLVAAVDAGTCTLTHQIKGTGIVVADACERANAVATVLEANASE